MLLALSMTGCNQAAKKLFLNPNTQAQVPLIPEVTKYATEPNIALYRSATVNKETLKLEEYIKRVVGAEIGPKSDRTPFFTCRFNSSHPIQL